MPIPIVIDYSPVGALAQAAENVWNNRPREVVQRMGGTLYGGTPDGPATAISNAGTGMEVHGAGYIPGQAQYTVPGSDQQQGTDASSGAIDPQTGQPINQTAAAMPAAPTTFTVNPQQKQQLANIDADSSMSAFDKDAARRKVLGQPAPTSAYTLTDAQGNTQKVNLTQEQLANAVNAGLRIKTQNDALDLRKSVADARQTYDNQLVQLRNEALDLDHQKFLASQGLAGDKKAAEIDKAIEKNQDQSADATIKAAQSEQGRYKDYLDRYVESHANLKPDDQELVNRQAAYQQAQMRTQQAILAKQKMLDDRVKAKQAQQSPKNTNPGPINVGQQFAGSTVTRRGILRGAPVYQLQDGRTVDQDGKPIQ